MRSVLVSFVIWLLPVAAIAQDGAGASEGPPAVPAAEASEPEPAAVELAPTEASETAEPATTSDAGSSVEPAPAAPRPKVAVVVVGDPDPVLVAAAVEIEAHLSTSGEVRLPAEGALRAALRGDSGTAEDGLDEVRRERRRLGLGEASDAPVLARLGRRAGAVLVVAVRESPQGGPEAVALDVRSAQYFDGALPLDAPTAERTTRFAVRRARVAARGAVAAPVAAETSAAASGPPEATVPPEATQAPADGGEPDWFEQNWPYFAAGGLLAAAIVFVVVTATEGGDPPPMLRFQPPGAR